MLKDIKKRSYMWWKLNAAKQNCFFYFRYNYKYFKEFPTIIFHFNKTFQSSGNYLLNHEIVFIYNVHIYENLESGFKICKLLIAVLKISAIILYHSPLLFLKIL